MITLRIVPSSDDPDEVYRLLQQLATVTAESHRWRMRAETRSDSIAYYREQWIIARRECIRHKRRVQELEATLGRRSWWRRLCGLDP